MSILNEISEYLQKGKAKIVKELIQQAIDQGIPAHAIPKEGTETFCRQIGAEKYTTDAASAPDAATAFCRKAA